jgi:hypothetical protein
MWEGLECELCKTSFEDIFIKDKTGSTIDLLGVELPKDSHYIFLESVNTEEILKKTRVKVIHIDISISRLHGVMKVVNGELWIEDKDSKFGCLQLASTPIELNRKNPKVYL